MSTVSNSSLIFSRYDKRHKWKPSVGQWCWFYNFTYDYPILMRFDKMHCRNMPNGFCYCEAFAGELPSFLKDNK